jgi:glycine dehydrogenase
MLVSLGRIIGVSVDAREKLAFRMALQTREQHIRREKANSNICTAQVLLANIAALYAIYHGPTGIKKIANRIHRLTAILANGLDNAGLSVVNKTYFDTQTQNIADNQVQALIDRANLAGINLRMDRLADHGTVGVSLDECTTRLDIERLWQVLLGKNSKTLSVSTIDNAVTQGNITPVIPDKLIRQSEYLRHPIFSCYHSETEMMRYIKRLENKDISLANTMIPLGSGTMKLNAAAEMIPISWPEFAKPHPFTPVDQMAGYQQIISELEDMLTLSKPVISASMRSSSEIIC